MLQRLLSLYLALAALIILSPPPSRSESEEALRFPESTLLIQEQAFYQAENVRSAYLPNGVKRIESKAFAESGLTFISLPASLEFIAEDAFSGCTGLTAQCRKDTYAYEYCKTAGIAIHPLPLTGIKIGIDPGHQQKGNSEKEPMAPGSTVMKAKVASGTRGISTKTPEYIRVLEISLILKEVLIDLGADVYMTRETHDVNISNMERALMMNELGADLVLRIHLNGSSNQSANGIGLYVNKTGDIAEESLKAAEAILPAMIEATGARKDGIFKRDTYTGLNWSTVPCILVEAGFMTNPEEDLLLADPSYRKLLAEGMAEGVCRYFLQ